MVKRTPEQQDKDKERLAQALKANLRRRKAQSRGRQMEHSPQTPDQTTSAQTSLEQIPPAKMDKEPENRPLPHPDRPRNVDASGPNSICAAPGSEPGSGSGSAFEGPSSPHMNPGERGRRHDGSGPAPADPSVKKPDA